MLFGSLSIPCQSCHLATAGASDSIVITICPKYLTGVKAIHSVTDSNIVSYTTTLCLYKKSKDWAAEVLTEDVDVAVCKYVSVIVARLALNHHQIIITATVGLTYWRYCQRLLVAGKLELCRCRVRCLHIHNVSHKRVLKPQDRDGVLAKFVKDDVTRQLCFYDTTWYDKLGLYLCAPKSWRTASLVCRTEPTNKKSNE